MAEGERLYAGTHEGMFVFRSSGRRWSEVSRALEDRIFDSIAGSSAHPERVYAGAAHDGVYRTDDGGLHWTKVLDGDIRALAVDATNDEVVYAGSEPVHLYRSDDHGQRWEEVSTLVAMPAELQKRWWSPQSGVGHIRQIFVHPDDPRIIYLALEHGGVVRSLDGASTWEDVSLGLHYDDIHMVAALPGSFTHFYASSARGFFTTEDAADGWRRAENGFTRDYFHDYAFLPPNRAGENPTILIGTADHSPGSWNRPERARSAMFRSDDCAASWHRVGEGLPDELTAMISTVVTHPSDINAAFAGLGEVSRGHAHGAAGPGQVLLTRDRGDSWEDLHLTIPADRVLLIAPE